MSFIIRPVRHDDLSQLVDLAKQFNLLNLPGDKRVLGEKIDRSEHSFAGKLEKHQAEYAKQKSNFFYHDPVYKI